MSAPEARQSHPSQPESGAALPGDERASFTQNIRGRHRWGAIWRRLFQAATVVGIVALCLLALNITNRAFGLAAIEARVPRAELSVNGVPYEELGKQELIDVLETHVSAGMFRQLQRERPFAEWDEGELRASILEEVIAPRSVETWPLWESLTQRDAIHAQAAAEYPDATVEFYSWIDRDFITEPQSRRAEDAGVRTAILGSLWTILITILVAFPLGVGAAIYLEEYAQDNALNRVIQTNINNLAGVPSIIYGMLGLAIFVRALEVVTSGVAFGAADDGGSGRTILSAGLTLALLILPLIIINGQEAIRAVPGSLREASYGLGATQWQTIWSHVLPAALPGILTGTILAISRAIGETAPIVVVGAATFITADPDGPFSQFTTLPIQIYQWTSRPQDEFRHIAAAAIIVLLALLLTLNATAVYLRNRYRIKLT